MASTLSNDSWQLILSLLEERHIYKLRCIGANTLLQAVSKMKSGVFYSSKVPSAWPSRVHATAPLEHLSVGVFDTLREARHAPFRKSIELSKFPQTLRSLALDLSTDDSPFGVLNLSFYESFKQAVDAGLPNLTKLCLHRIGASFWAIPASVTDLDIGKATILPENLPRNLRRLMCTDYSGALSRSSGLPKTLEWLYIDHGELAALKTLPSLTFYRGYYNSPNPAANTLASRFPSLTSLVLENNAPSWNDPIKSWLPASVRTLHLPIINYDNQRNLPSTLTSWTFGEVSKPTELFSAPNDLASLPPFTSKIALIPVLDKRHIPADIMERIPKHLTTLDIRWFVVTPAQMALLPTSLTSLLVHNVTGKSIAHLKHLTSLALHGGVLTNQVAKSLPLGLRSLTLTKVALRSKGHYQRPGETEHRRYSKTSPQWSTLKLLPRNLTTFIIAPSLVDYYFYSHVGMMLALLPAHLHELGLIFEPHGHRDFATFIGTSDNASVASADFGRFESLNHLYLDVPMQLQGEDRSRFSNSLPRSLTALYCPFPTGPLSLPNLKYTASRGYSRYSGALLSDSYGKYWQTPRK